METIKLLSNKIVLGFFAFLFLFVCIVLLYAISRDAELSFSKDKWLTITPKGSAQIQELKQKVDNSVSVAEYNKLENKYQKLEKEHQELSRKLNQIEQSVLPTAENDQAIVPRIQLLCFRARDLDQNIEYSYSVIRSEITRNGTINTKRPAKQQERKDLYQHIQKCLSSIGAYNGECNGDQSVTCNAVMDFQASNKLMVDGIIGKNTWKAIEKNFEKEKAD
ncbi:MAG: peptidoglycan-binding domain-containing protein [Phycisphaerae bacterium]|jgi:chromosome segregation ATPase